MKMNEKTLSLPPCFSVSPLNSTQSSCGLKNTATMVLSLRDSMVESNGEQSEEDSDFLDQLRNFEKDNQRVITAIEIQTLEIKYKEFVMNYFVYHQQTNSVTEYERSFLELKRWAETSNEDKFDEKWVVSIFVKGLKEEIKDYMKFYCPDLLQRAFVLAKWGELSLADKVFDKRAEQEITQDESATICIKEDTGSLISFNAAVNLNLKGMEAAQNLGYHLETLAYKIKIEQRSCINELAENMMLFSTSYIDTSQVGILAIARPDCYRNAFVSSIMYNVTKFVISKMSRVKKKIKFLLVDQIENVDNLVATIQVSGAILLKFVTNCIDINERDGYIPKLNLKPLDDYNQHTPGGTIEQLNPTQLWLRRVEILKSAYTTKVSRNANISKLQSGYLFPEVTRKKEAHLLKYPDAQEISLRIGDTTEPIPEVVTSAMAEKAYALSTLEGYSGYGVEQGERQLRAVICSTFYTDHSIEEDDLFVFNGAKCDISLLQVVFGSNISMDVQDPSYPAYVDSNVNMGQTGQFQKDIEKFANIEYMRCAPENGFFPDLSTVSRTDVIFFCSPNNPTGSAASREQLTQLVQFAKDKGSIIVYDSAYAQYMSDDNPKSIFEIPGAKEVAIETSSFSKYAGFTGVRLGWTLVPKELLFSDGFPVAKDFNRIVCTCFNGASNISQTGGLTCLSPDGLEVMQEVIGFYKENTDIIVETFSSLGFKVYGTNAPYVWVHFPGRSSWDVFLEKTHVVTTTGSGFGPDGEDFVRDCAFGHQSNVLETIARYLHFYPP